MEDIVTSTMKIRTPSGEYVHHHHPYAVGSSTGSSNATIHSAQQIGGTHSNASDFNDLEFYSGPSSHDVMSWKNVGTSSVGVLGNQVHHGYGPPVNVGNVGRDASGMEALAIRISTGNGSLGSRSDGTDLVIDDLISNPDDDEAMVPPIRSGGSSHRMLRDRSLSGDQPIISGTHQQEQHPHRIPTPDRGGHAISNPLPISNSRASSHHIRLSSIDEPSNSRFRVNEEFSSLTLPEKGAGDVSSTVGRHTGISTASAPPYLETKADINLVNRNARLSDPTTLQSSPHSTVSTTAPLYSKLHAALTQPRPQPTQSSFPVPQANINCTRCGRELSSKCLMQTCIPTDETKCRRCGNELTTKCLLAMCLKNYPYN